jgi:hypothetical protein
MPACNFACGRYYQAHQLSSSFQEYVDGLPDELKVKLSDLVATSSGDGHVPRGETTKRIYDDVRLLLVE